MINEINIKNEIIFGSKVDSITYIVREGVYGVVFNDAGQVAIIKNSFGYFLPGGGIEKGESLKQCLVREFKEEAGYDISIKNFIGKASKYYFSEAFNHYRHPVGYFYDVKLEQRITDPIEKDHELLWLQPHESAKFLHEHQQWAIEEALRLYMIENIKEDIKRRCDSPNNFFGIGSYEHIESVARNAIELAKLYQADVEICEVAGWLHDIASITDYQLYESHHIHGASMAEEILKSYNYPEDKIELVKLCILNHRGSVVKEKTTKEEICVADADAISHYDTLPSLFYLAFVQRKLNINDAVEFVKRKLERSYNKMSEEGKEYYKHKRDMVQSILVL